MNSLRARLDRVLGSMLGSEDLVRRWWDSPNRAFDMRAPAEVFDTEPDAVVSYILGHVSGGYC